MAEIPYIPFEQGDALLDWHGLADAFTEGHRKPRAQIGDTFLYRSPDTLLSRAAWIDGIGAAVKTATVFPDNPAQGMPMINGAVCLYSDGDGTPEALLDFHLVTKWKTAGDSLLAALRLARGDSQTVLFVGAGTVSRSLCDAFAVGFPAATQWVWNRTSARADELAAQTGARVVRDLESAVRAADIIVTATMSKEPVIRGDWLRAGQHLNMIGAYRPDMREADDSAICAGRLYVDSFDTTLDHIGELKIPLDTGVLDRSDILADYYNLDRFTPAIDDITVFKNGGGAHLDLMTSRYILDRWNSAT